MKRILVIDDDVFARDFYRYLLCEDGFEVETAPDGEAGLARFDEGGFNLVILGIFCHGLGTPELVRRMDPEVSGVPLIAIFDTGPGMEFDPVHIALTVGASRSFPKSFDYRDLVEAVHDLTGEACGAARP